MSESESEYEMSPREQELLSGWVAKFQDVEEGARQEKLKMKPWQRPNNTVRQSRWTPERNEQLCQLHAEGKSATVIGNEMGITRNAVIGKLHRLHAPPRMSTTCIVKRRESGIAQRKSPRLQRLNARHWMSTTMPVPSCEPVSFADLRNDFTQCRFAIGEAEGSRTMFCAAPTNGKSAWCSYHQRIVYDAQRQFLTKEEKVAYVLLRKRARERKIRELVEA